MSENPTTVAGDSMYLPTIYHALFVFAVTLIVNKSEITANKREFVRKRYQISVESGEAGPWTMFVHKWWHAMWVCPMCLGMWVALASSYWFAAYGMFLDTCIVFGLNWLIHCIEDALVSYSKSITFMLAEDTEENTKEGSLENPS